MPDFRAEARDYDRGYEADWEDEAHAQRGEFLRRFPLADLSSLTLGKYAIGQNGHETFCYWVEPGTRKWAKIVGATADKFGVYYGKTKSDRTERFRYTKKFSSGMPAQGEERAAFRKVRGALTDLLAAGDALDFLAIDLNPLSQMLKAKILSLYFPDKYLPICSADNLRDLAPEFGLDDASPSEIQHRVLTAKASSPGVRTWSTLKYMAFCYEQILRNRPALRTHSSTEAKAKRSGKDRKVDYEKLMALWRELGKKSEAFALAQEQARLISMDQAGLARQIKDRTSHPGYGFDFESFSGSGHPRYIEVKTFTAIDAENSRFFLSQNEYRVATDPKMRDHYYFYLVVYGADHEPADCQMRSAKHVLEQAEMEAQSYLVRLGRHQGM